MIVTEIFYGVKCNRCGEICESGEFQYWSDEDGALQAAYESDWIEEKGSHYCPDCYHIDEETDEVKVRPPYPEVITKIRDFLWRVLKHYPDVKELEDCFEISFHDFHYMQTKPAMTIADDNWIKAVAPSAVIKQEKVTAYQNLITIIIKYESK